MSYLVSLRKSFLVQLYFYLTMVQNIFLDSVYFGSGTGFGDPIVDAHPKCMAWNLFTFME